MHALDLNAQLLGDVGEHLWVDVVDARVVELGLLLEVGVRDAREQEP